MRILYLDCGMGAAGDMLTAALLELFPDREGILEELNALGLPGVRYEAEKTAKCGILGTHIRVTVEGSEEGEPRDHDHHHSHSTLSSIDGEIARLAVSPAVAETLRAVYREIAQAESKVHGVTVEQVHFHEVGAMDALADITAVCYLMEKLHPDKVVCSPVHVGSGRVNCAHGILPVPAPATQELLRGIPIYGGSVTGELCTPTGAALLRRFVTEFGNMPVMAVEKVGYGMGKKDFPIANCLRAMLGTSGEDSGDVVELSCNLDDMTGEEMGYAVEALRETGALEVYTTPVFMKKNRPGTLLTVLCKSDDREKMVRKIFRCTTTLGVREAVFRRYTLDRHMEQVETSYGAVRCKVSTGCGVTRRKLEYEDLARIAREKDTQWPLDSGSLTVDS